MAGSVNKVLLIGHLGRDPEIRLAADGSRSAQLSVGTTESWRDKTSGEHKERTEWHRVVIWDQRLVEVAEKYLTKDRRVYLEGTVQTRTWTDASSGRERRMTEVVLPRFNSQLTMLDKAGTNPPQTSTPPRARTGIADDDIPF